MLNRFSLPKKAKPAEKKEQYSWEYDQDVIDTGNHIEQSEKLTGGKLTHESVATHRGLDMVFENNEVNQKRFDTRAKAPPAAL